MPEMTPVATQIQPPNPQAGLGMLSSILGIRQQQRNLQTGQYQQQAAAANANQAQQQNTELQALGRFTVNASKDPSYLNPDGTPNVQKYQQDAMAVAPVYGQAYIGQMTSNFNAGVENRKSLLNLSADQQQKAAGFFAAIAAKPGATNDDLLEAAEQARGLSDDPGYQRTIDRMLMHAPQVATLPSDKASAAVRQYARQVAIQAGSPAAGESSPAVQMVQGPNGLVPTNVNPQSPTGIGQVGPTQAQGVPPSGQIITDSLGRQFRYNAQTNQLEPVGNGTGGAPPGKNGGPQFTQAAPQQQQIQANIEEARKLGDQVGVNRDINQRIIQLAGQARTGPGTAWIHQAAAAAGLPSGASYQELGAFLDRQAAMAAHSMGLPETNLGVETAKQFTGNTQYNNSVILDKTKFVDALNTAAGAYRAGLDKAVGTGPNPNYNAYQGYRQAWAKNFDPEIFAYENAFRAGDKSEMTRIEQDEGRRGMAELRQKRQALMRLVNGQ